MKIEVAKNAKRNIAFGIMNKVILMILPFVIRSVINIFLGAKYLGLNSLFSSILSVLALSELGFSGAMVYHMYKPIADNDQDKINALLNLYRKVYRVIGLVIICIGCALIPFLHLLINDTVPENINVYAVYMIELANTALSYFLFGYKQSLLVAYQREDIKSIINLVVQASLQFSQAALIIITHNYYFYILCLPLFTAVNNVWIGIITKKMFPDAKCEGNLDRNTLDNIKKLVAGSFIQKACATTRNSLDSICVSAYLGLTLTAIYNNYYVVFNGVRAITYIAADALAGGIGNHVVIKTKEENYEELKRIDFLYMIISGWCTIFLLCLFQPFMRVWMGEKMQLPMISVVLFCIYFYTVKIGDMKSIYTTARGLWWKMKYRSIFETITNLVLNVGLGKLMGINGIIIGTAISLVACNFTWGAKILFDDYFGRKNLYNYFLYHLKYAILTFVFAFMTYRICGWINISNDYTRLFINILVCTFVPLALYGITFFNTRIFKESIKMLKLRKA